MQVLLALGGILQQFIFLGFVIFILLLLLLVESVHLSLNLPLDNLLVHLLSILHQLQIQPVNLHCCLVRIQNSNKSLNFVQQCLHLLLLVLLLFLVLLLPFVILRQVLLASIDQILLNVKIAVVKLLLFVVEVFCLVFHKVVVIQEHMLVLVMHIYTHLLVTVATRLHFFYVPPLMHAVIEHHKHESSAKKTDTQHGNQQWVVRVNDQITALRNTELG